MYSFDLLEQECYYIVQLKENEPLTLVQVKVKTDNCMYTINYGETPNMQWMRKSDLIADIVECLSDAAAEEWFKGYNSSEDASYYEEDED